MKQYSVIYDDFAIYVNAMTDIEFGFITVSTLTGSSAELSDMSSFMEIEGLINPVYYFNRIKCHPRVEGTGQGKAMMIEVCKVVDEHGITIYNTLNPYGNRSIKKLKEFFRASGFEDFQGHNVMVRKPLQK